MEDQVKELGQGSYGIVRVINGFAVKQFSRRKSLIQEYCALRYLRECSNVVKVNDMNIYDGTISMCLHDTSLRNWLSKNKSITKSNEKIIMIGIIQGLVEIHDKGMIHGDIKPSNILIEELPLRAVLGDCGFVSLIPYAKVQLTAAIYRDPVVTNSTTHDIYSLGIIFLELLTRYRFSAPPTYEVLAYVIRTSFNKRTDGAKYIPLLLSMVGKDKNRRPSIRNIYKSVFNQDPPLEVIKPRISIIDLESTIIFDRKYLSLIKNEIDDITRKYNVHRSSFCYKGLLIYFNDNNTFDNETYRDYVIAACLILASNFGDYLLTDKAIVAEIGKNYNRREFLNKVVLLIKHDRFLEAIMSN